MSIPEGYRDRSPSDAVVKNSKEKRGGKEKNSLRHRKIEGF
jgi:hypothetical protein